ncbi:MAG: T9SS type A sorting domain-containing protein [Bacteroidales bacterium]|jgi:hypothetical protein|nr:T9SS type A sorting domain-containing protein [Bacteroidales bacterium]
MKKINLPKKIIFLVITGFFFIQSYGQTYLYEDFETGIKPDGWSYIKIPGSAPDWQYLDGGFSTSVLPNTGHPQYAKEGVVNAMFHQETQTLPYVKLVTPTIDLSFGIKPELAFWHAQDERFTFEAWHNDELRVYYKEHVDSSWKLIAEYTEKANVWVERIIQLPDSTLSGTYYIAFEGKSFNGYGVCIDSVALVEKGIIPKYVESIDVRQASTEFVATESKDNAILRLDFTVKGNDGDLLLDSLAIVSLNTDDNDIDLNGVKLYASNDNVFSNSTQIGSGLNFTDGKISFININRTLPTGLSSVWVTNDIAIDVDHKKHNHILDLKILKESIKINTSYYPLIDKSPDGERIIYESILFDDFETDKGWTFTGEFERAIPEGLGGNDKGSPDPDYAVSGDYIIGTDITGLGTFLGDYENNLGDRAYTASSPYINCKYYTDIYLYYDIWFNMDTYDTATVDLNTGRENNWEKYWQSSGTSIQNQWSTVKYELDNYVSREDSVQVRFTLGPTNGFFYYSGWNIDNLVFVGNYIEKDVAVTEWIGPVDGCGHTDEEYITIKIKNLAGEPMDDPLPVSFSFDGGSTIYYDTILSTISVDDSLIYMIDKPIDLTNPGWYNNVYAETHLAGDEYDSNNKIERSIFITPTYNLPYSENFETNYGYYLSGGTNSSWEYGTPDNVIINSAASGENAWVTNLDGYYFPNDSSYLLSPCFNFVGKDSIVFEFKCNAFAEDKVDGLSLLYSIDDGDFWNLVPKNNDFYWNWYSEVLISELGLPGIDSTNGEWITFRQLLPPDCSNQNGIKFKFVFGSDQFAIEEGAGIDDIKIYEAPYDVGVTLLTYPYDRCEWNDTTHVKVYVENYGITDIKAGTKIPISLNFESEITIDTLTLTSDLTVGNSVLFTFGSTFDMSYAGDFDFIINTKLESNTYFYNETVSNDTLYETVTVQGMPNYNPFQDQIGDNPIDTFLVAGVGYAFYNWSGGGLPDITPPQDTLYVNSEAWYKVTVTNGVGCTAIDSVEVVDSEIDLAMDTLFTELEDSCQRNTLTELSVRYRNNSIGILNENDTILLGYQINNNLVVQDTMFLSSDIGPGATALFTYNTMADLRTPDEYTVKVFTNFLRDLDHADDTVFKTVNTWGYVDVELANDTIYSSQADTLELIATPGYDTYSWNTGSSNDTITPTNLSYYYKVVVSDANICSTDIDSTYIETYDYGISNILGFIDDCDYNFAIDSTLKLEITNYSGNTYDPGDTIRVLYKLDEDAWINNTITLTSTFNPSSSQIFDIGVFDATIFGNHSIKAYTSAIFDANHTNDTIEHYFETWPFPNASLAYDTILTSSADTVVLEANSGWTSYLWNTGSTSESISITNPSSLKYIVEVSDEHGCGMAKDSTQILTYNIGISDILSPINSCEQGTDEIVRVEVHNFSNDTLLSGKIINVSYTVNNSVPVNESFALPIQLLPDQTTEYQFSQTVDLSAINLYTFKVYTDNEIDVRRSNDTIVDAISTYGYPTIEIGGDYYTTQPETIRVVAEPGFVKYEWNNGVENDTLDITYPASYNYVITVTNTNGCNATDSLYVYTYNILADSINAPIAQCDFTNSETIIIGVTNNSEDTLQIGEPLEVGYRLNSDSYVSDAFTLTDILYPDSTELFSLLSDPADLSENRLHGFNVFAKLTNIDVLLTDTTFISIDNLKPNLELGADINTGDTEHTIDAGPGYVSYLWFDASVAQTYIVDINDQNPGNIYSVTVTNSYGCSATDEVEVTFTITPDLAVTDMFTPEGACWNATATYPVYIEITNSGVVNLNSAATITVGYTYDGGTVITEMLDLGGAPLNANDVKEHTFANEISFPSAKDYLFKPFVKHADDGNVSNDTLNTDIEISSPIVILGSNDTISTYDDSYEISTFESYDTYLWSDGSEEPTMTVTETGLYSVTITDELDCNGEGSIYISFLTDVNNLIQGDGYKLTYFPNPVSEKLMIQFENKKSKDIFIEIVNSNGQILYNNKLSGIQNSIEKIDVNSYANGVYFIRFRIDQDYYIRKLIIQ